MRIDKGIGEVYSHITLQFTPNIKRHTLIIISLNAQAHTLSSHLPLRSQTS